MDAAYFEDAPIAGPAASLSAVVASVVLHNALFGCGCGCFQPTRHAALLAVPCVVAASGWYGVLTAVSALSDVEAAVGAARHLIDGVSDRVDAVVDCAPAFTTPHPEIDGMQEAVDSAQASVTTAASAVALGRDHVELGLHAVVGFVVVLLTVTGAARYVLKAFPLCCCSGAPSVVSGAAGVAFMFAQAVLVAVCTSTRSELEESEVFRELVLGQNRSVAAAMQTLEAATERDPVCREEVASLGRAVAPGLLNDAYGDYDTAMCTAFDASLLHIGMSLVFASVSPLIVDVLSVLFCATAAARATVGFGRL